MEKEFNGVGWFVLILFFFKEDVLYTPKFAINIAFKF